MFYYIFAIIARTIFCDTTYYLHRRLLRTGVHFYPSALFLEITFSTASAFLLFGTGILFLSHITVLVWAFLSADYACLLSALLKFVSCSYVTALREARRISTIDKWTRDSKVGGWILKPNIPWWVANSFAVFICSFVAPVSLLIWQGNIHPKRSIRHCRCHTCGDFARH